MKTIVLYHGGCRDGFCAAWVVNKYMNDREEQRGESYPTEYIPAYYGIAPPDIKGHNVIIVDFCYPIEIMHEIYAQAKSMIWLDHHKTASQVAEWMQRDISILPKLQWIFDNNRSGAGIAWDYFFQHEPRPWLVDYVEDRDLWAKKLNNTDVINAYIATLEFNFEVWEDAEQLDVEDVAEYGQVAEAKTEQYVKEVCKNVYYASIRGQDEEGDYEWDKIPIVNICQVDCSEVLHELCKRNPNKPFSLYWFKRHDGMYQYGLRSIGDFDVSVVAKLFDGGGHKNAAGFQLKYLLEELR